MPHTGDFNNTFGALSSILPPPPSVSGETRPVTDRSKPGFGLPKIRPFRRPTKRGATPIGRRGGQPVGQPTVGSVTVDPFQAALERREKKGGSTPNNPADLRAKAKALRIAAL